MSKHHAALMTASAGLLPPGYAAKEYLEANGTQYLTTPLICNHTDIIRVRCAWVSTAASNAILKATCSTGMIMLYRGPSNMAVYPFNAQPVSTGIPPTPYKICDFMLTGGRYEYEGKAYTSSYTKGDATEPLHLFRHSTIASGSKRIYGFSIERAGVIICNLIPCMHQSTGEAMMYDTVSKTPLRNEGSGHFLTN